MKKHLLVLTTLLVTNLSYGQISAKLMRYMDVSDNQIVFVYGGDVWLVAKQGGTCLLYTSPSPRD